MLLQSVLNANMNLSFIQPLSVLQAVEEKKGKIMKESDQASQSQLPPSQGMDGKLRPRHSLLVAVPPTPPESRLQVVACMGQDRTTCYLLRSSSGGSGAGRFK
jgi:hypothetical protein